MRGPGAAPAAAARDRAPAPAIASACGRAGAATSSTWRSPAARATILSVEQDYEDRAYFTVTVDDDPGQDLGAEGKPGHRFFFAPEEVEPLAERLMRVLVAGIGNVFLGDDGFGVEVVPSGCARGRCRPGSRWSTSASAGSTSPTPCGDYDAAILVDAVPRGGAPGTLYVLEPDVAGRAARRRRRRTP